MDFRRCFSLETFRRPRYPSSATLSGTKTPLLRVRSARICLPSPESRSRLRRMLRDSGNHHLRKLPHMKQSIRGRWPVYRTHTTTSPTNTQTLVYSALLADGRWSDDPSATYSPLSSQSVGRSRQLIRCTPHARGASVLDPLTGPVCTLPAPKRAATAHAMPLLRRTPPDTKARAQPTRQHR